MWSRKSARESALDEARSRAQNAADVVAQVSDEAQERFADAVNTAEEAHATHVAQAHVWKENVRENVAGAAAHAWEVIAHKASELAGELSQRAQETAQHAQEAARAKAAIAAEAAHERLEPAQKAAQARLAEVSTRAASKAHTLKESAAAKAPEVLHTARDGALRRGGELGVKLGEALIERAAPYAPHALKPAKKESDLSTKLLWLGLGVFAGALIALLLAPNSGRRNRALIKDKLTKASHDASELGHNAAHKATDLSRRAAGVAHDLKDRVHPTPDDADDATIEARVRSELGSHPAARDLERLNVEVVDGIVTLRGPLVEEATRAALEAAVRAVKGVRDVKSNLLVAADDDQAFVG
jgi:hyperosmotically inducible periplasmic protein